MDAGPFKTAADVRRMRDAAKFVAGPEWVETFVAKLKVTSDAGRRELTTRLECPAIDDDPGELGHLVLYGREMASDASNCSARVAYVDAQGDHWNIVRCNGPGGHAPSHRNAVTNHKIRPRRPIPHTHYLSMASIEAISGGVNIKPDNYVVPGGRWNDIRSALVAVARRTNLTESPAAILDPARVTTERRLP